MLKGCVPTPSNQEGRVSDSIPRRGTTTMDKIINDFTINIATANGTGSQSANLILLQSLFDMGGPSERKKTSSHQTSRAYRPGTLSDYRTWGTRRPVTAPTSKFSSIPATWDEDLGSSRTGNRHHLEQRYQKEEPWSGKTLFRIPSR